MKHRENLVNLFWAIIWAVVLICAVAGWFGCKVALYILGALALGMVTMFVVDYIQVKKLR